jgi:hypothetical protein
MWKEAVVVYPIYYFCMCLEGMKKSLEIPVRIPGVPAEIRTENF